MTGSTAIFSTFLKVNPLPRERFLGFFTVNLIEFKNTADVLLYLYFGNEANSASYALPRYLSNNPGFIFTFLPPFCRFCCFLPLLLRVFLSFLLGCFLLDTLDFAMFLLYLHIILYILKYVLWHKIVETKKTHLNLST